MPLRYRTGEQIKKGDRVMCAATLSEIELLAEPGLMDIAAEEYRYVQQFGGGVMVREAREPKMFGRVFLDAAGLDQEEDLVLVSRAARPSEPQQNG